MDEVNSIIENAKLRLLESEIARNESEREKLLNEARKLKKEGNLSPLLKYIIAAVIAGGLLTTWIITYYTPIANAKSENETLKNEIFKSKNEKQEIALKKSEVSLEMLALELKNKEEKLTKQDVNLTLKEVENNKQKVIIEKKEKEYIEANSQFQTKLDSLNKIISIHVISLEQRNRRSVSSIEKANLNFTEQTRIKNEIDQNNSTIKALKGIKTGLDLDKEKAIMETKKLSDQSIKDWVMDGSWTVTNFGDYNDTRIWKFEKKGIVKTLNDSVANLSWTVYNGVLVIRGFGLRPGTSVFGKLNEIHKGGSWTSGSDAKFYTWVMTKNRKD